MSMMVEQNHADENESRGVSTSERDEAAARQRKQQAAAEGEEEQRRRSAVGEPISRNPAAAEAELAELASETYRGLLQSMLGHRAAVTCLQITPDNHVVSGSDDGSVRVWHTASWQAVSQVVLESQGKKKPPLIWSVLLLSDLCVITGDSTGHVSFFDGKHGTIVGRFASHQADVLTLAATADEANVFASGVDQKARALILRPTAPSLV